MKGASSCRKAETVMLVRRTVIINISWINYANCSEVLRKHCGDDSRFK